MLTYILEYSGTFVRTKAIDLLVESFLRSNPNSQKQIISLGAGTDTRYWRLRERGYSQRLLYHEIDFPDISAQKLATIRSSASLSPLHTSFEVLHKEQPEEDPKNNRWGFFKNADEDEGYLFHPIDMRRSGWIINNLLPNAPTLLISECCLCYMTSQQASSVVSEFTRQIHTLGIVIYEPTKPNDDFGKVMFQNLASRGLTMPTVADYPSLESQMERLRSWGFDGGQNGADTDWLWKNWMPAEEKQRVNQLEMLDEVEEWELLAQHYLITWGWKDLRAAQERLKWPRRGSFGLWEEMFGGMVRGVATKVVGQLDGDDDMEEDEAPPTPKA
jgi:[phosphatase 2A protein]-leucine-carboxy methyltransferase